MINKIIQVQFELYENAEDLENDDFQLLKKAEEITYHSYSPYSNFCVGSAVLLENGEMIQASNQENAAYPAGVCAEQISLLYAHSRFPHLKIKAIAVTARRSTESAFLMISPCGICRQSIMEMESAQKQAIRIILQGEGGKIYKFSSASDLLPLQFDKTQL